MSARPGHPRLRFRIAERLGELLTSLGGASIGEIVGHDRVTPGRRGPDPDRWPLSELRMLADHDVELHAAVLEYWMGAEREGDAVAAIISAHCAGSIMAKVIGRILDDVRDGRVSVAEAMARLPELRDCRAKLDQVIADYEATVERPR